MSQMDKALAKFEESNSVELGNEKTVNDNVDLVGIERAYEIEAGIL